MPIEPASVATTVIAYASMNTSRIRPPTENGLGICEDTVSSCVEVQNRALPKESIAVGCTWRSNIRANTADTRSTPTVTTTRTVRVSRSRAWVGVRPCSTFRISASAARMTDTAYTPIYSRCRSLVLAVARALQRGGH